jgi:ATP-dependent protease Clp ATPase subunit
MKKFIRELLCDENSLNEKTFIGLCAFVLIVITLTCDIITGFLGREMPIHEFVFDGIMFIVLGAFFGTSLDKWINRKGDNKNIDKTPQTETGNNAPDDTI